MGNINQLPSTKSLSTAYICEIILGYNTDANHFLGCMIMKRMEKYRVQKENSPLSIFLKLISTLIFQDSSSRDFQTLNPL
jgi:hypothetical protein